MINLQDKSYSPTLEEVAEYVGNPTFMRFCTEIKEKYSCSEKIEYSRCSMEPGWNVKFKKAGRALCTLYPKENFFTVMVVTGVREKETVEAMLPEFTSELQEIYMRTEEGNGQRWLMIDLEDQDGLYRDVFRLIAVRMEK